MATRNIQWCQFKTLAHPKNKMYNCTIYLLYLIYLTEQVLQLDNLFNSWFIYIMGLKTWILYNLSEYKHVSQIET